MITVVRRAAWLLMAAVALCVPLVASAEDRGSDCSLLTVGNDMLTVYTWADSDADDDNCNVGAYGIVTGPLHPSGPGLDLLQNGDSPETSFNTVYSFTTGTAYVMSNGNTLPAGSRGTEAIPLAGLSNASLVDPDTIVIEAVTASEEDADDWLEITVTLRVFGTNNSDSAVEVLTTVSNPEAPELRGELTPQPVTIGVRHLWDYGLQTRQGLDAGPTFYNPHSGTTYTAEANFNVQNLALYQTATNEEEPFYWAWASNSFREGGPDQAERGVVPVLINPTRLDYVCAPAAAAVPYAYTTSGQAVASADADCSGNPTGDSGVAYYFETAPQSAQRGTGISLQPGQSITVGSWLWTDGFAPPVQPELCLTLELDATQVNGNLGIPGLQNNDVVCGEDVLEFPSGANRGVEDPFELFFDGSDVGITRTIIDGMDIQQPLFENGDFARGKDEQEPMDVLLSFNIAHSIPPIGLVLQSDIVRFVADENGTSTDGHFERFFDGSDIGLQSSGEDIDAFLFEQFNPAAGRGEVHGDLYFSTKGNLNIPGLSARDEDIVVCRDYRFTLQPGGDIASACGSVELYFDGSEAGLANASEDVDAFAFGGAVIRGDVERPLYLSTRGNFNVNDVGGRNEDVFACYPELDIADRGDPLPITACSGVAIVFDGSDYGLRANNVFSIDLLMTEAAPPPQ